MTQNFTFFRADEDFMTILSGIIPEPIVHLKTISTGWTNIVIEITTASHSYIARFPRNQFFANQIAKDVAVSSFIQPYIQPAVPAMQLHTYQNRCFSIHQKISGIPLTECLHNLTATQQQEIAAEIAHFLYALHQIPTTLVPSIAQEHESEFVDTLLQVTGPDYERSHIQTMIADERQELVFIHGDLNIGNVLLDEQCHVSGFLDFAFAGLSDRHVDLSIIACRVSPTFLEMILAAYEQCSKFSINRQKVQYYSQLRAYCEQRYIDYLRQNFPEVAVPA